MDAAVAAIRDEAIREAAAHLVEVGLRRRYEISQLLCGVANEKYPGLVPLLAAAIPPSVAAVRREPVGQPERTAAAASEGAT